MDFEAVRKLEGAGDVAGLAKILSKPRFELLGDAKISGEGARRILGDLPYKSVHVVDLSSARRLDVSVDERIAAAAALGRIGTKEAAKALIDGLKDFVPIVRLAVFDALKAAAEKLKGEKAGLPVSLCNGMECEKTGMRELEGFRLLECQIEVERYFGL